jgi:hypothetical protein
MGLGFTFYSGAMEAWLVDALAATGYRACSTASSRAASRSPARRCSSGRSAGGLLGQIDLSIPYVVRAVLLAAVFVVAYVVMHDSASRRAGHGSRAPGEVARNARAGVAVRVAAAARCGS